MDLDERRSELEVEKLEVEVRKLRVETKRQHVGYWLDWYKGVWATAAGFGAAGAALKVFGLL